MSLHEYRLVAAGWFILILVLTIFWYATLSRLSVVLKEHLSATRSHQSVSGFIGLFLFLLRGEFKQTGDERIVSVCRKLRQLLYGYLGVTGAFFVFLVIYHPRY
jgi:hypothetical protein